MQVIKNQNKSSYLFCKKNLGKPLIKAVLDTVQLGVKIDVHALQPHIN